MPDILEAFERIQAYSNIIDECPFDQTPALTRAVLQPVEYFEEHCLREGEPHEISLFRSTTAQDGMQHQLDRMRLRQSVNEARWDVGSRWVGPQRRKALEKASPLKKAQKGVQSDPERYLKAALKLLDIYPSPLKRAREHVTQLLQEHDNLLDAIQDQEEASQAPIKHETASNPFASGSSAESIERAIKREELEILALKALNAEREKELEQLTQTLQSQQPAAKPRIPSIGKRLPPTLVSRMRKQPEEEHPVATEPIPEQADETPPRPSSSEQIISDNSSDPVQAMPDVAEVPEKAPEPEPERESIAVEPIMDRKVCDRVASKIGKTLKDAYACEETAADAIEMRTLLERLSNPKDSALTPVALLECHLLSLFLRALLASPADITPTVHLRDPPSAVLISSAGADFCDANGKMGMILMNDMKALLISWLRTNGWADELATKAIYGLVAKAIIKIDRRTREAFIFFEP